jgi:hypothetical protein
MEPEDAVSLLNTIDSLGTSTHFAYFLPARSPFFNTSVINDGAVNSQAYQSLFVLYPMFNSSVRPYSATTHEPETYDYVSKSLYDAATCILQGVYINYTDSSPRRQESIVDLAGTQFVRSNDTFEYSTSGERYFHFGLLDVEEHLDKLTVSRVIYKQNRGWLQGTVSDIDWLGDKAILPDSCFKGGDCTPSEGTVITRDPQSGAFPLIVHS